MRRPQGLPFAAQRGPSAIDAFDRRARARCCSPDGGALADAWSSGMMCITDIEGSTSRGYRAT